MAKIKPPPLVTKTRRDVESKKTVGAKDPTDLQNPLVSKTRADFRAEEFTRIIRQKGYFCTWRKALLCTCFNPTTNQAALNCEECDGSGYNYIDPILIQAVITRMNRETDIYKHAGQWLGGDANATTEPQYRLGYRDSLEMRDSIMPHHEQIQKHNREGMRSHLPDGMDTARYRIVNVAALQWRNQFSGEIIRLEEGQHFKINKNGWIEWLPRGEDLIPDGDWLSIHYDFHPVWIVSTHENIIRDTVTARKRARPTVEHLPVQVKVMLDYLTNDVEKPAPVTGGIDG